MNKVEVRAGGEPCPRCSGKPRLTATIGERSVPLCPECDAASPAAGKLLAYFSAHTSVLPQDAAYVSDLLGQWLASMSRVPAEPKSDLAAEAEAWWARYK
ncbi:DUF6300 family protein [Catelliglobosispora koreensis]|uniref:DUF6300 family protein n=1 Tax=Catelliglobosispora koreensis TaxID=129052 RepID=UPI000367781C|nr:DUF6300 family protein [Catelliglobosispora koreensis]